MLQLDKMIGKLTAWNAEMVRGRAKEVNIHIMTMNEIREFLDFQILCY